MHMSKMKKKELSLFLNDAGRVVYNELCRRCVHSCKQSHRALVIECRRYLSKRAVEVRHTTRSKGRKKSAIEQTK